MTLRTLGFGLTVIAVVALLASLVLGLRAPAGQRTIEPVASVAAPAHPPPSERIRVEVLNAAGVSGLAARVTQRLRAAGFDVVYYGNASGALDRDSTTLLDRSGNVAAVTALAHELGIEKIETAIDTTLYLEATLILAEDWEEIQR
ncbi:MAG TPA: LytR C-terminal domain-containing protein [Longimicrobiaceae bacterium]|nr:LytR C-terminal domain-containing protein [Longimicrobiaceae bacterium]